MGRLSRRLEDLLGAPWEALDAEHLRRLIGFQEDFELDLKATLCGNSDGARQDFALDVAKFANHQGGLLLLGIEEDADARVADFPGVEMSDDEEVRMRSIIASSVFPHPVIHIGRIPAGATQGVYAIYVPPSRLAPHAVKRGDSLKYPVRDGSGTRYLSESDLADRYRARFAGASQQANRLREVHAEGCTPLSVRPPDETFRAGSWLLVSLVPATLGNVPLGVANQRRVEDWLRATIQDLRPLGGLGDGDLFPLGVAFRRFEYSDRRAIDTALSELRHIELHIDGAGFGAVTLTDLSDHEADGVFFSDEQLVDNVVCLLYALSSYATKVAGLTGDAAVTVEIIRGEQLTVHLGHTRGGGMSRYRPVLQHVPASTHSIALDDTAAIGAPLLAAARMFLNDLVSTFGLPEVYQINADGLLLPQFFNRTRWAQLEGWATGHGVVA